MKIAKTIYLLQFRNKPVKGRKYLSHPPEDYITTFVMKDLDVAISHFHEKRTDKSVTHVRLYKSTTTETRTIIRRSK